MHVDLQGRVAIVTGGGRDIGRAISFKLAGCGAAVAVNYRESRVKAEETVRSIRERGGTAVAVEADVTDEAGARRLVETTLEQLGDRIHILVNNAGGLVERRPVDAMDAEFVDRVMALNVRSVFVTTRAALPHLPEGAAIVNMSSLAARHGGGGGSVAYAASKGAVLTLTRGMAKEFAPRRIRVNCVSPGLIDTLFHDTFTAPEARAEIVSRTPAGREGTADDVANAVLFLASEAADFITGESIEINGGIWFV